MSKFIYNFTQHQATPEQVAQGVKDLEPETAAAVRKLLTFEERPSKEERKYRAKQLAHIAKDMGAETVMIGGALYLMSALEDALEDANIKAVYAWAPRISVDQPQPDGTVKKMIVFRHMGFIEA